MLLKPISRQSRSREVRKAFTLLEILVVVAIIVLLASVGIGVMAYFEGAKRSTAKMHIKEVETAWSNYVLRFNVDPPSINDLAGLNNNGLLPDGSPAPLKKEQIHDPWGGLINVETNQKDPSGVPYIWCQPPGQNSTIISNRN